MALNIPLFKDLIPEFSGTSDSTLNAIAAEAQRFVTKKKWDTKSAIALIYYTAHLLKVGVIGVSSGGAGGSLTKEKVGDVEQSFSAGSSSSGSTQDQNLESTPYGRQFIAMRKSLLITPMIF